MLRVGTYYSYQSKVPKTFQLDFARLFVYFASSVLEKNVYKILRKNVFLLFVQNMNDCDKNLLVFHKKIIIVWGCTLFIM